MQTRKRGGYYIKKRKTIPEFKTLEEEATFWDTHSTADYQSEFKEVNLIWDLDKPKSKSIVVRIQPGIKKSLETVAQNSGLDASSLARMWIIEKLKAISK